MLEGLAEFVRYHSLHIYTGSEDYWTNVLRAAPGGAGPADHRCALSSRSATTSGSATPSTSRTTSGTCGSASGRAPDGLEERYTLADALAVATFLHAFVRHSDLVRVANLAQLVATSRRSSPAPTGCSCSRSTTRCGFSPTTSGRSRLTSSWSRRPHELSQLDAPTRGPTGGRPRAVPGTGRGGDLCPGTPLRRGAAHAQRRSTGTLSADVTAEIRFGPSLSSRQDRPVEELNGDATDATNSFSRA